MIEHVIELENKEYAPVLSRSHSPELKAPFELPPIIFGVGDFICAPTASHKMVVDKRAVSSGQAVKVQL